MYILNPHCQENHGQKNEHSHPLPHPTQIHNVIAQNQCRYSQNSQKKITADADRRRRREYLAGEARRRRVEDGGSGGVKLSRNAEASILREREREKL